MNIKATDRQLATLQEAVDQSPHPLLFATLSGAHLYGFPSPDSDFDLRGAHVLPARDCLRLRAPQETITFDRTDEIMELDLVTHDVKKFFSMMLKPNGYVLEQVCSPLVLHGGEDYRELVSLVKGCLTRHHVHHYRGFANNQWAMLEKAEEPRVKPLCYVYRVLLTGIHLMRTGAVECNLQNLNQEFELPQIPELLARKISGPEKALLDRSELPFHRSEFERLQRELDESASASHLPDKASAASALDDLLLRLRLGN